MPARKHSITTLVILFTAAVWPSLLFGQTSDFGTEYGISWSVKPLKGGELTLGESIRLTDNSSRYSRSASKVEYNQAFLRSRLKPIGMRVSAGASYELIHRASFKGSQYFRHRIKLQAAARKKMGDFQMQYRFVWQNTYRPDKHDHRNHLRNRLKLSYSQADSRWGFYLSEEMFYRLDSKNKIDEWRTQMGATYRIDKNKSIDLNLRRAEEWQVKNPETLYLVGLGLNF